MKRRFKTLYTVTTGKGKEASVWTTDSKAEHDAWVAELPKDSYTSKSQNTLILS